MRRTVAVAACLVAILGFLAPAAFAQAPTPKVTINGLFDQITSTGANLYDGDFSRKGDHEWYARTRFRPDFTFEVGRTKAVMGLEMDVVYGQTGNCGAGENKAGAACVGEKNGSSSGSSLNTDVSGIVEFKWLYTEFDLTGKDSLLPFIPVNTVARAGLQPFATLGTYRGIYTAGDFPGLSAVTTWAPNLKTNLAYVMIDEALGTFHRAGSGGAAAGVVPTRGDDFAVIFSPEFTPFKGLDIKPIYSYLFAQGTTSSSARRNATNITTPNAFTNGAFTGAVAAGSVAGAAAFQSESTPGAATARYANGDPSNHENRHTIGLDARWRSGPFSLDPTVLFQFGTRSMVDYAGSAGSTYTRHKVESDISAFIADVQGGFQLGPLLIEGRAMYSTGNSAGANLARSIHYYEPLDVDTNYWITWANIFALGIDYFNGNPLNMSNNVGYDRYGRAGFGVRVTYSLTPELAIYAAANPTWTAEKVDTDTAISAAASSSTAVLRVCSRTADIGNTCFVKGDSSYLGTEADLGLTWRFAPNTAFDLVGAYLFAGSALDTRVCPSGNAGGCYKEDAHDAWTVAARVRLAF
jgi:hypothetical protein